MCSRCLLFAIEIGHGKEGCDHEFSTVMPSFFVFFFKIYNNNPCYSEFDMASSNVLVIIKQQQNFFFQGQMGMRIKRGNPREQIFAMNVKRNFSLHMRHCGR